MSRCSIGKERINYASVPEFSIKIPVEEDYHVNGQGPVVLIEIYSLSEEFK